MDGNINYPDLVRRAQLGQHESVECLSKVARAKIYAYIYRLTLNHDLASELSQETLVLLKN